MSNLLQVILNLR